MSSSSIYQRFSSLPRALPWFPSFLPCSFRFFQPSNPFEPIFIFSSFSTLSGRPSPFPSNFLPLISSTYSKRITSLYQQGCPLRRISPVLREFPCFMVIIYKFPDFAHGKYVSPFGGVILLVLLHVI